MKISFIGILPIVLVLAVGLLVFSVTPWVLVIQVILMAALYLIKRSAKNNSVTTNNSDNPKFQLKNVLIALLVIAISLVTIVGLFILVLSGFSLGNFT